MPGSGVAQLWMTESYRLAPPAIVSPFERRYVWHVPADVDDDPLLPEDRGEAAEPANPGLNTPRHFGEASRTFMVAQVARGFREEAG